MTAAERAAAEAPGNRQSGPYRCMIAVLDDAESDDVFDYSGWSPLMEFYALRAPGIPGTTKYKVGTKSGGGSPRDVNGNVHRCMIESCDAESKAAEGWSERGRKVEFYAWSEPHPGTTKFFVGEAGDPDDSSNTDIGPHRCILSTHNSDTMNRQGWRKTLTFYAFASLAALEQSIGKSHSFLLTRTRRALCGLCIRRTGA